MEQSDLPEQAEQPALLDHKVQLVLDRPELSEPLEQAAYTVPLVQAPQEQVA